MAVTVGQLSEKIEDLYWMSARREVCNMMLFFLEIQSNMDVYEAQSLIPECPNFENTFKVWTGGQGARTKEFDTRRLFEDTLERAKRHYEVDSTRRLARHLLQSSSFLDIDVLYEPAIRSISSQQQRRPINVERIRIAGRFEEDSPTSALRGIMCSGCSSFISSSIYFECCRGCEEQQASCRPTATYNEKGCIHMCQAPTRSLEPTPRRLCHICITKDLNFGSCGRDHFFRINYQDEEGKAILSFQREIMLEENKSYKLKHYKSKSHKHLASALRNQRHIAQISRSASKLLDLANSRVAPSGFFHLSMMFGPLIFESGTPSTKHGVLISPRPYPDLFHKSTITFPLVDGLGRSKAQEKIVDCLVLYKDMTSHEPCLLQRSHSLSDRSVLCCVKRVYGAAFSGYAASTSDTGNSILDTFILEARKCKFKPSKTVESRRRQLHRSAENVTRLVKEMLGDEVRKYLNRIASLLMDSDAKLTWHILGNNCQRLIDRLLKGKDFEYTFPRLPKGFGSVGHTDLWKNVPWPRYLISFGDRVEGKDISIQQPNSSVTKFCRNDFPDGDIIDFLELEIHQAGHNGGNSCFKDLSELALVIPQPGSKDYYYSEMSNNAIWDLPRDSLSILQYHLLRPSSKYSTVSGHAFDETLWTQSRLRALHQIDTIASYTGSLGLALLDLFHREPNIISKVTIPKSRIFGSLRSDEKVRIIRSGSMVGYVIAQRQERLTKALDHAETIFIAIQKASERYFGKASAAVLNSRTFKSILMQVLKPITDHKEMIAKIRTRSSLPTHLTDIMLQPSRLAILSSTTSLGSLGSPGGSALGFADSVLALELQAIQIANRDNWIFLNIGDVVFAYQIWRKSKSIRKELQKENSRKPVATG